MAESLFVLRLSIGLYFIVAGVSKFVDRRAFAEAVRGYDLIPARWSSVANWSVPPIEVLLGVALALGLPQPAVGLGAALFTSFLGVIVLLHVRAGRKIGCGCVTFAPRRIGWGTVAFDFWLAVSLVGVAFGAKLPSSSRSIIPFVFIALAAVLGILLWTQYKSTREAFEAFQGARGRRPKHTALLEESV